MENVVPFRVLSPGNIQTKPLTRQKFSKLSLKKRFIAADKNRVSNKENKPTIVPRSSKIKDKLIDILTSDESDSDGSFAAVGGCGASRRSSASHFGESFSLPAAESTRYEDDYPNKRNLPTSELDQPTLETSELSTEYVTALPLLDCDESVICLSDSGNELPNSISSKADARTVLQGSVIVISSDESYDELKSSQKYNLIVKTCQKEDEFAERIGSFDSQDSFSFDRKKSVHAVIISPSVKSGSSIGSVVGNSVLSDDCTEVKLKSDEVMKTAQQSRGSIKSIISSSVLSDSSNLNCPGDQLKHSLVRPRKDSTGSNSETSGTEAKAVSESNSKESENESRFDKSSSKKSSHLALPDSSSSQLDDKNKCTLDWLSAKRTQLRTPSSTLCKDKYQDIRRWILRTRNSGDDSDGSQSDHKADMNVSKESSCSLGGDNDQFKCSSNHNTPIKIINDNIQCNLLSSCTPRGESSRRSSYSYRIPSLDESEDKFEALLNSVKQKRINDLARQSILSSSFINDSSLEEASSPYMYHKDIAQSAKVEAVHGRLSISPKEDCRKRIFFAADSDDDQDKCHFTSESDDNRLKPKLKKPIRRHKPASNQKTSSSDSDSKPSSTGICFKGKTPCDELSSSDSHDPYKCSPKKILPPSESRFRKPSTAPKSTPRQKVKRQIHTVPYSPIRTFLSSLSGPSSHIDVRSHPEASKYWKDFKKKKEELTRRLFKLFNREVFDSRLPQDMSVEWSARMSSTAGYCSCKLTRKEGATERTARIVLSTKVVDSADRLRDTLIHEMCHAAVWLLNNVSGGHGPFWRAWANKAMKRFPELPKISMCHDYSIQTKYTYRCTNCGYCFGRHSKSLDLEKKVCGHCHSRFEVFLTKNLNQKGGNIPSETAKTPKMPSAFALFVKENYHTVKTDNVHLKHGDIMKKLGAKFSQMRLKSAP